MAVGTGNTAACQRDCHPLHKSAYVRSDKVHVRFSITSVQVEVGESLADSPATATIAAGSFAPDNAKRGPDVTGRGCVHARARADHQDAICSVSRGRLESCHLMSMKLLNNGDRWVLSEAGSACIRQQQWVPSNPSK